jgi:hypothetical protein
MVKKVNQVHFFAGIDSTRWVITQNNGSFKPYVKAQMANHFNFELGLFCIE